MTLVDRITFGILIGALTIAFMFLGYVILFASGVFFQAFIF